MRMLTGQAIPDSGHHRGSRVRRAARVQAGARPDGRRAAAREPRRVAHLRVRTSQVWATLLRVPRRDRDAAVARRARGGPARRPRRRQGLHALRRACAVACSSRVPSCTSPALVLLDEPTVGLDPQVRGDIWTLIDRLRSAGRDVLMSTHYIEEAERLCDDVAVVSHGTVIARGTPVDARHRARRRRGARVSTVRHIGWPASRMLVQPLGFRTRRTGPSVSVLRAEALPHAPGRRARRRRCAARRTSRTSSSCSPERGWRTDGRHDDRNPAPRLRAVEPTAFAGCVHPRDHAVPPGVAVHHVREHRRADDQPARVRLRLRRARLDRSRHPATSQFVGTGIVAVGRAVLVGVRRHVRHLREALLHEDLRRHPRHAGRRARAVHRRGARGSR